MLAVWGEAHCVRPSGLWPGLTCTEAVIYLGVLGPGTGPGTRDPEAAEHARLVCTCKGKQGCRPGPVTSLHVTRLATTRSGTSLGEAVLRPAVVWMSPRIQIYNNHPKSNAEKFQGWSLWEVVRIWCAHASKVVMVHLQ